LPWLAVLLPAVAAPARELTLAQAGELPVLLTAPHGGREEVPGCPPRTPVGSRFVTRADFNTDVLALGIADELTRLTGGRPYVVVARFQRRYIDANRRPAEAYGAPGCRADYEFYHAAIRRFVDDMRAKFPHAMLIDVHGQSAYADSILRGTQHGATVQRLLARAGRAALTGPDSVFGRLASRGHRIVPADDADPADRVEAPGYTGGYTVQIYGGRERDGIDAIQLEFGRELRAAGAVDKTARDAASAIAAFYERYLR
jgi:N-formylglutamate amidohydrolase